MFCLRHIAILYFPPERTNHNKTATFYMIALAIILKNSYCDVASNFCDINWVNPLLMDRLVSSKRSTFPVKY